MSASAPALHFPDGVAALQPQAGGLGRKAVPNAPLFSVEHFAAMAHSYVRVIDVPDAGFADVVFLVGGQRLGGLRRVLGLRCAVLERMLLGDFVEARCEGTPVPLPEFDDRPGAFRQFLYYLHTGCGALENVEEVLDLYEISKFFGVGDLTSGCSEFLHATELTQESCIRLCSFAVKHEMWDLTDRAANYIAEHADTVLAMPEQAATLPETFLRYLFQANNIEVSEVVLVQILLYVSPEKQKMLVPFIRLPRISAIDMMKIVVPSGLFDKDACLAALAFRENPLSVELPAEAKAVRERSLRVSSSKCGKRGSRGLRASYGRWGKEYLMFLQTDGSKSVVPEDMFAEIVEDEI